MSALALYKQMLDNGISPDIALAIAEKAEADQLRVIETAYRRQISDLQDQLAAARMGEVAASPGATARQARNRRYYEGVKRKRLEASESSEASEIKTHKTQSDGCSDVSDDNPLSLPPSPQTPQPPTHTRVSVQSRERADAREEAAWDRFWSTYPRKVSKSDARRAFAKAWKKLPPFDEEAVLIGGLERAKAAWVDPQFIPHAATWLNGERWTDEPNVTPLRPTHERTAARQDDRLARKQANLARALAGFDRVAGSGERP